MHRAFEAVSDVEVEEATSQGDLQDSATTVYRKCDFCGKEAVVHERTGLLLDTLTAERGFFCPFCVRNAFHTKNRKHVLIMTFRGLIGYMYHICYFGREPRLYLSQLHDLIQQHVAVGELNPLFTYDPSTFCWFVDFSHVGETKKKIPVQEVIRTTNEIISAFNPYSNIRGFKSQVLTLRYKEAIMEWYQNRRRPEGKAILSPTMKGCADERREVKEGNSTTFKKVDVTVYRDFLPQNMRFHARR